MTGRHMERQAEKGGEEPARQGRRHAGLLVIGMGEDGLEGLSLKATRALFAADAIFTSQRLAKLLPEELRERARIWPSPFSAMEEEIAALRAQGRKVAVVASGNPFFHGVGALLARRAAQRGEAWDGQAFCAPSSFSLACARLGWAQQEVRCISLHGKRDARRIEAAIQPGARLLVLADGAHTPAEVARRLLRRGFGESRMIVLEHLGGKRERMVELSVAEAAGADGGPIAPLHVLAVECRAGAGARILPLAAGLPDGFFEHDGQLTKSMVRAITIGALEPRPGALLWDVGAGCGSVTVEWLRLAGGGSRAWAVERKPERCEMIARNADALGGAGLEIVAGEAPRALEGLPVPDAVFIGGGVENAEIIGRCMAALRPGGILVANAVTTGGEAALAGLHDRHGGELARIAIARSAPLGGKAALRPALPVTQFRWRKEAMA